MTYPADPLAPPTMCKIEVSEEQNFSWSCEPHNVQCPDYANGNKLNIGQLVNDVVAHVGEAASWGALQSIILDLVEASKEMRENRS